MARNTSYEAKRRYEKKAGWEVRTVFLNDAEVKVFKESCDTNGDSYNSILVDGIREYIALNK